MKRKISPIGILTIALLLLACGYVIRFTGQIKEYPLNPWTRWRMREPNEVYPQQLPDGAQGWQTFMIMSNELNNPQIITKPPVLTNSPYTNRTLKKVLTIDINDRS